MTDGSIILTALPEVIGRQILVEWLVLRDVVRLDSAHCGRSNRTKFAALAYGNTTVYSTSNATKAFDFVVSWSILKGARVDCVCLTRGLGENSDLCSAFLSLNRLSVKRMILHEKLRNLPYEQFHGSILHITESCPNIVDMNYHLRRQNSGDELDISVKTLMVEGLAQAVANCVHLERLELWFPGDVPPCVACPSLKSLVVVGADSIITDAVIIAMGQNCPRLEQLHYSSGRLFGGAPSITDAGVEALLEGCPLLHDTNIHLQTNLRPDLRIELARRAQYEELRLSQWRNMTTELLEGIMRVSPALKSLDGSDQHYLSDTALAVCADHCPRLETLKLSGCSGVTSDGLCAFVSQAGNRLKDIDISETYSQLGDETVLAIAAHCPNLEWLHAPRGISDEAIVALAEGCPRLLTVELQFTAVSTAGIAALAKHCPALEAENTPEAMQQLMARGVLVTAFHRPIRVNSPAIAPESVVHPSSDDRRAKTAAGKNCCTD